MTENIEDYGGIEGDSSDSALSANVQAIDEASEAASDNAVYLPEGEWYIGAPDIWPGNPLQPGSDIRSRGAAGLSFVGDGPDKTFLSLGLMKDGKSHAIRYSEDSSHPGVTWENLTYDGRYQDFNFDASQTAHWGLRLDGDGDFTFRNVRFRNWAGNGIFTFSSTDITIDRCTFHDIGIKVTNDNDGTSVSHAVTGSSDNQTITIENSEFTLVSGSAVDFSGSGGVATVDNCWASGFGTNMFKFNDWESADISRVYFEANTQAYQDKLTSTALENEPDSAFLYHISGYDGVTPTVTLNDIEVRNIEGGAFSVTNGYDLDIQGARNGPIAVHNTGYGDLINAAFRGEDGQLTLDLGEVSVHDVDGPVFNASTSLGTIDTLHWDRATDFGDAGDISIGTNNEGGSAFSPAVPTQSDVGIETTSGSSSDDSPSVSWVTPSSGSTVSGSVTLQMSASDSEDANDSLTVEYRVDGGNWSTASYNTDSGYYEATWDTSTVSTGDHTLEARATDSAGNTSNTTVDVLLATGIYEEWTPRWESTTSDWSLVSGSEFEGGYAKRFDSDSQSRHAISWDNVGEPSDVEILDKFRVQQSGLVARSQLRSSTTNGNENGYWLEFESTQNAFRLGKYTNGDWETLSRFGTAEGGTFYFRRFRAEGDTLKAKVWRASENEPSNWDVEVTDGDHSSGWVGFGSFSPGVVETDVISVATGGETAPFVGRDSAPGVTWATPTDGSTVTGSVVAQIEATDSEDANDSLTVEYRVDGGNWSTASYNTDSGYYEATWDTTQVADGDHTLEATVTDSGGNTSSASVTVTSDNASGPVVDSLSLSEVETSNGDAEFDASWQVSDSDGDLNSIDLSLIQESDGSVEDSTSVSVSGDTASGTTRLIAAEDDGTGNGYSVELTVTDSSGSTASDTASATELEETTSTAPSITRFSVSEARRPDPHAEVTVVWDVSDPDGDLDSVEIEIADANGVVGGATWTLNGTMASDTDSFRISEGDGTTFDVTLTVTDATGQTSSRNESVSA